MRFDSSEETEKLFDLDNENFTRVVVNGRIYGMLIGRKVPFGVKRRMFSEGMAVLEIRGYDYPETLETDVDHGCGFCGTLICDRGDFSGIRGFDALFIGGIVDRLWNEREYKDITATAVLEIQSIVKLNG